MPLFWLHPTATTPIATPKLTFSFFAQRRIGSLADFVGKTIGIYRRPERYPTLWLAPCWGGCDRAQDVKFVSVGNEAQGVRAIESWAIDAAVAGSELAAQADLGFKMLGRATSNGYAHALANREQTFALTRRIARLAPNDPTPEASYQDVTANRSLSPTRAKSILANSNGCAIFSPIMAGSTRSSSPAP
jgi:hypothetical protein